MTMNGRMVFVDFFRSQSRKIFFSFFLSFFLSFFFQTGSLLTSSSSKFISWNIFYLLSHLFHLILILFFWILVFEKFILVDIVVLIREFYIYFYFSKTLFLFVSAAVVIVLLIQSFVKFWSTFCQTNYYHE